MRDEIGSGRSTRDKSMLIITDQLFTVRHTIPVTGQFSRETLLSASLFKNAAMGVLRHCVASDFLSQTEAGIGTVGRLTYRATRLHTTLFVLTNLQAQISTNVSAVP